LYSKLQLFLTHHVHYTPFILRYECFWNVFNRYLSFFFSCQFLNIVWILFIVLYKIDSFWRNKCSFSKVLNQNFILNFYQMDFWFEFLNVHMNEIGTTCHDFHGFKWRKKFSNFDCFFLLFDCFWVCLIVTAPIFLFLIAYPPTYLSTNPPTHLLIITYLFTHLPPTTYLLVYLIVLQWSVKISMWNKKLRKVEHCLMLRSIGSGLGLSSGRLKVQFLILITYVHA
jgi:hypothetical protein